MSTAIEADEDRILETLAPMVPAERKAFLLSAHAAGLITASDVAYFFYIFRLKEA